MENSVKALPWCLLSEITACFALSLRAQRQPQLQNFLTRGSLPHTQYDKLLLYNYNIVKPARLTRPTVRGGRAAAVEAEGSWSRLLVSVRAAAT